jgi:hypothetical protein
MITQEIETTVELAGYKRIPGDSSIRAVFARGSSTLIVHEGGDWACYTEISGTGKPYCDGADFRSLRGFLKYESTATPSKNA